MYDTQAQLWTQTYSALSAPRCYHNCVKIGSHVVLVGGYHMNSPYSKDRPMTAIHIKHVIPEWTWVKLKPYLLLRKLIDDNRATPITATQDMQHINADMKSNTDVVV